MKKILLTASSVVPQVITETFYALVRRDKPFIPDEIHVITTEEDLQNVRLNLWPEGKNMFSTLCGELGVNADNIRFDMSTTHLMRRSQSSAQGSLAPDLNDTCEDLIVSIVRQFALDDQVTIHASIAGGRKNTGFYLGYAMSLFGREHDELSHVLVPPSFEYNQDFFYPPKEPKVIWDRDHQPHSTADATVCLVDIPFVRLRNGYPQKLLNHESSFSDVVQTVQSAFAPAHVRIELKQRRLICAGIDVKLSPALLAWYAWFASLRLAGNEEGLHWLHHAKDDYLYWLAKVIPVASGNYMRTENSLKDGLKKGTFLERNAKIKRKLKKQLNDTAEHYFIQRIGYRPFTRYCLNLPASAIEIVEG